MTKTVRVPGALLAEAGRSLYGDEWTGPLARALGINLRTVQRWKEAAARGEDYQTGRSLVLALERHVMKEASRRMGLAREVADRLNMLATRDPDAA